MLYQDTLTGTLHEVPDSQVGWGLAEDPYGMGEVYDGLGQPLGWGFKSLTGLIKKVAPIAMSLSPYGQIISRALPIARRALAPVLASTGQALQQQAMRQFGEPVDLSGVPVALPAAAAPVAAMMPAVAPAVAQPLAPMRPRLPFGWRRPPVPYTGPRPRRIYLRCSAWPGPRGLVPVNPGVATPAAATPVAPGVVAPAVVTGGPVRYRGRGRRR
jgi:hypothetical protein